MDNFEQNRLIVENRKIKMAEQKKLNEQKRKLYAEKRLEHNIIKKIKTTMIGALASFEDGFGFLWGIDLDYEELDGDQLELRESWEEIRREILNKGNMQIRAAQDELSEYNAEWTGFTEKIDFITKERNNDEI